MRLNKDDVLFPWEKRNNNRHFKKVKGMPPKPVTLKTACSLFKSEAQQYLSLYSSVQRKEILEKIGRCLKNTQKHIANNWIKLDKETKRSKANLKNNKASNNKDAHKKTVKSIPDKSANPVIIEY